MALQIFVHWVLPVHNWWASEFQFGCYRYFSLAPLLGVCSLLLLQPASGRRFHHWDHLSPPYMKLGPSPKHRELGAASVRGLAHNDFQGKYSYFLIVYLFKFRHPADSAILDRERRAGPTFILLLARFVRALCGGFIPIEGELSWSPEE